MSLIDARNLVKTYGDTRALDGFDLTVERGRIVGLIGPNGAGKTTALKAILGLGDLDTGELQVDGLNPAEQRARLMQNVAYIADTGTLPRWMRIRDLIDYVAGVHPNFDRQIALATLEQTDIRTEKRVRTLSKGMNVQLHLALILAIDASLLVLDEPTLGLDILYRQQFYDRLLSEYYNEQRSILITTHEVREIEHILTDVVFIHRGRVRLKLEMAELSEAFVKVTSDTAIDVGQKPIHLKQTLNGWENIYRDVPRSTLEPFGTLSTPSIAEIFVAIAEDQNEPV